VIYLEGPSGRTYDIHVMRFLPGEELGNLLPTASRKGNPRLAEILEQVGAELRALHSRYPGQEHNDFHPSNVLYDQATRSVYIIDIGFLGRRMSCGDVNYFLQALGKRGVERRFMDAFRHGYATACLPAVTVPAEKMVSVSRERGEKLGMVVERFDDESLKVTRVVEGPLKMAGVQVGWRVLRVAGTAVHTKEELVHTAAKAGTEFEMTFAVPTEP